MEPIFDRSGRTVAWLEDDVIIDRQPRHRAFVSEGAVFTYDTRYLGTLDNGFFRDRHGDAVAFMESADGGPIPPIPEIPPIPPIPPMPPIAPIPPIPPIPPIGSFSWSKLSWDAFLAG